MKNALFGRFSLRYTVATMETLSRLFGGEAKVKLMRLFLLNPESHYSFADLLKWTKLSKVVAQKELKLLLKIGVVTFKRREKIYTLNPQFHYLRQLQSLLVDTVLLNEADMLKKLGRAGKIKLVVVAGVFLQEWESRADLLVVGDRLKDSALKAVIHKMELELGRELRYAALETPDFKYRLSICDKLIRDILDYRHKVVLDRFGLETKV